MRNLTACGTIDVMANNRERAAAAARALRLYRDDIDDAIRTLEAYAATSERIRLMIAPTQLRALIAMGERAGATRQPPAQRPAA